MNKLLLLFGKINIIKILTVAVIFTAAGFCQAQNNTRNVILLIGDGMGVGTVSISDHSIDNSPFRKFPIIGLVKTKCADSVITDSGAGVTAISTGHRQIGNTWVTILMGNRCKIYLNSSNQWDTQQGLSQHQH